MSEQAIDVWLKFDTQLAEDYDLDEDMATHEANTYKDGDRFYIAWYLNSVGLVTRVYFDTYEEVVEWYTKEGFDDYSS